jgi:octaprenyl-diphosphate synthase
VELDIFAGEVRAAVASAVGTAAAAFSVRAEDVAPGDGKQIRPRLVYECAATLGADYGKATRLAAAIEMVHLASLCHDDVIDNAATRRGRPSLNARVGNHASVLMGDYLYASASRMVARELGLRVAEILADTVVKMTDAELRQSRLLWDSRADYDSYLSIIEGKTAALFSACTAGTAAVAGAPEALIAAFSAFGRGFGLGFQIIDDVLDYSPQSASWGKEPLKDLKEGLVTLPLIFALGDGDEGGRGAALAHLASHGGTPFDPAVISAFVEKTGAVRRCADLADHFVSEGTAALSGIARADRLTAFARESLDRKY